MTTELTTQSTFAVAPLSSDALAELQSIDGGISFDYVKLPAGGGITFEIPTDNPDEPDVARDITGVIINHHATSTLWLTPYSGENVAPDCQSFDGKIGTVSETGETRACATCQYNAFGDTGRKLCRNSHKLYILREGEALPIILNVPPSSIKAFNEYAVKRVVFKGKKLSEVVTKITLKKAVSRTGIAYSQVVFTKVADLDPEQVKSLAGITAMVKGTAAAAE